jgi:GDPmannose 4,6-dehydratase
MKTALITGITGMDGSHMADLLLSKGYKVFGMVRHKSSGIALENIAHIQNNIELVLGDLSDYASLVAVLSRSMPDEIYNFAAQSFVGDSWKIPEHTSNITGLGVGRLLDAVKLICPKARLVQASSSEMFGNLETHIANEASKFNPCNPYGIAKLFAHHMVESYRDSYNMFVCSSICFNHESERRALSFVTRKISNGVALIHHGLRDQLVLGDLRPRRDWGYAPEYVEGIWQMLQQDSPEDYVFATGASHSVEDFVQAAFAVIGVSDWQAYVVQDPALIRPVEVTYLKGDATKAQTRLGWQPRTSFAELVQKMVDNDVGVLTYDY